MKHLRNLLLNASHQQLILQIQEKKMKGCQLPAVEKKVELGIGLLAIQAKTGASINKSKEPIEDTNGQK